MSHIKKFIDKVSYMESRSGKDLVLTGADARGLRDELAKLISDNYTLLSAQGVAKPDPFFQVEIVGGKF